MKIRLPSILIIILLSLQFSMMGQPGRLRSTEVMLNGDVVLHWFPDSFVTEFYNYTIYYSPSPDGPFAAFPIITDMLQDTLLHIGAGANNNPWYYYMITNKQAGPTPPSDTLATMLLSGTTSDNEIIDLNWTPLHTPDPFLPFIRPWYYLYREYPPGNWAIIDSTQQSSMSYHFWECNRNGNTVNFRIEVRDTVYGCISRSNQKGEVLHNQSQPDQPVIDSVSIGPDGKVVIGWQAGSDPDIQGYEIKQVRDIGGSADSVGYVNGKDVTYFRHENSDPCAGPVSYVISAIDSCGNESPNSFLLHKSIYLEDIAYDPCLMTNALNWNEYVNFEPPLQGYRIFMSENNGAYQLLQTMNPGQTSYIHSGLLPNTSYSYYIRAFNQGGMKTSTSCTKEVTTYNSPRPLFMYTQYVTVENNDRVNILFYTDTAAHVQFYRILRSTSAGGPYTEAGTVTDQGQEFVSFSDATADVNAESYYYQVEVVDSCGNASVITNTARTIFLQCEALPDLTNLLGWNAYESWAGSVEGYRIYRRMNDNPVLELLGEVGAAQLTYPDDVSGFTGNTSRIAYMVEAFEGPDPLGSAQSYSNEVISEQEPKVYLPNAFMPKGINNMFKPVIVFVGSDGYDFLIYDRWGQLIYRTGNPDDAWDGKFNGQYVPQGVYVYLLMFRDALGQFRQIKGNVAVIY